jgi:hypothetical protein
MNQNLLQRIDVRVTTASGRITTRAVTNAVGQIPTGDLFSIKGDIGTNRVEILVMFNAVSYKIEDTIILFK